MFGAGESYAYSNPFYVQPATVEVAPAVDYSQPIAVPAPPVNYADNSSYTQSYVPDEEPAVATQSLTQEEQPPPAELQADQPDASNQAPPEVTRNFDKARAAFKGGDYTTALQAIDEAIKGLPGDATLHEFRALVLFAQKKYKEAAEGVYAVLSVGPGMNWETMSGLYPDVDAYVGQLRALESYQREYREAGDGHFLLAYHYLVLGHTDQAVKQLEKFEKLFPSDKLAPEIVKAFTQQPDTGKPKAQVG
jgi:predicted Zn-dependent protease